MRALLLLGLLWCGLAAPARALCLAPLCGCGVAAGGLSFGSFNPLSAAPADAAMSLRVTCGGVVGLLVPYQIGLGAGGSGNTTARRMTQGTYTLPYALYSDAARSQPWGDTGALVSGGVLLDALGLAPPVLHTVYARVPGNQRTLVPGSYSDTITITVTYY